MSRRWNWDFEDEHRGAARRTPPPPPALPSASAHTRPPAGPLAKAPRRGGQAHIRRRRGGALLALALLAAVFVALLPGSHRRAAVSAASARARAGGAAKAPAQPPPADEQQTVSRVLAYTPFVREGGAGAREVALTFDDGPGPYTPALLSVLEQAHVPATFFPVGRMLRYFGDSTAREIRDGDVIGDHTESHPMLARMSAHEQHEELFEQIARVELLGGSRPHLFRPPYGSFNAITLRELSALHLLMVLWSVDTSDYQLPGVPVIVQRAVEGAHPGAIILMHDGGGDRSQTIAALPTIIHDLRARGYRLVTVPQLLADNPPPRGLPLPASLAGD